MTTTLAAQLTRYLESKQEWEEAPVLAFLVGDDFHLQAIPIPEMLWNGVEPILMLQAIGAAIQQDPFTPKEIMPPAEWRGMAFIAEAWSLESDPSDDPEVRKAKKESAERREMYKSPYRVECVFANAMTFDQQDNVFVRMVRNGSVDEERGPVQGTVPDALRSIMIAIQARIS